MLLSNPKNPTGMAKFNSILTSVEPQNIKRAEVGDAQFDETDIDGSPSELAAKLSLYSDKQAAKFPSPDTLAPGDDSVESSNRKVALQPQVPWPAHQKESINLVSHALLDAGSPENCFLVATKKPANSRQATEPQLETVTSNEMLTANPVIAEALQQRHATFTHTLLLGDGWSSHSRQTGKCSTRYATSASELFHLDNVLNEVVLELNWLGEKSMYCLSSPEFQYDFIYQYASPALTVELRKLPLDDESEAEKLKPIVRMKDWLVSRRFDSVRNDIRKCLVAGSAVSEWEQ